jgi:type I restriction enzyme, S subunit
MPPGLSSVTPHPSSIPALLLQHFDSLADTPGAVPKLRALILELAFRGRLVSHVLCPDDSRWIKFCAELDSPGALPPSPFEAPDHWRWMLLKEVAEPCGQKKPDKTFTYVDVGAVDNERGIVTSNTQVLAPEGAPSRARKLVKLGSVIYSTVRPYLRNVAVVDREFVPEPIVSTAFAVLHPDRILDAKYLFHWLRSPPFEVEVAARMKGVAYPAISDSDFWDCQIPVPPPEEQRRIVAKVEQVLARCDDLEARQTAASEHRTRLVHSALDHLTAAKDEHDFRKQCSFLLHNSSLILDSVPHLRQAILSLAVQGRLVPQVPGDDPAATILSRCEREAKRLGIKTAEQKPPIEANEVPHARPPGWAWARLRHLGYLIGGGTPSKAKSALWEGTLPWVSPKDMKVTHLLDAEDHISLKALDESAVKLVPPDSLLMVVRGMILAHSFPVALNKVEVTINQDMKALRPFLPECAEFLLLACRGIKQQMLANVERSTHGTCKLVTEKVTKFVIGLPPLAEQRRIVTKVNELMRWCDALEARLSAAQTTATHLLDATLNRALKGEL